MYFAQNCRNRFDLSTGSLLLAATLSAACGGSFELEDGAEPVTLAQDINNADFAPNNTSAPYSSVVKVTFSDRYTCSALKISLSRFLTAAHCATHAVAGQTVTMSNELDADDGSFRPTLQAAWVHPTYTMNTANAGEVVTDNTYDVGVLDIPNTGLPALSNAIFTTYATDGLAGMLVAYGANAFDADNDPNRKQVTGGSNSQLWVGVPRAQYTGATATKYTHNILHVESGNNRQWIGLGDSGGPNLRETSPGSNVWQVLGVASTGSRDTPNPANSTEARVSNVSEWIRIPHNVTTSLVGADSLGFLENRHMFQCIGSGTPTSAGLYDCDGRSQPVDNQYWKLVNAGAPYFQLKNTKTGNCLVANANKSVTPVACGSSDAQKWRFVATTGGAFHLTPKTSTGECLDWNTGLANPLSYTTCNTSAVKDWFFYR